MKKIILAIFIILGMSFVIAFWVVTYVKNAPKVLPNGEVVYNLMKQSQPKANKILYEYVLKDLDKTPKEAEKIYKITPNMIGAFEYDLNDNGQKEVIGYVASTAYCGCCASGSCSFFILEKQGGKYENISRIGFKQMYNIYISPKKINGYKTIIFYDSEAYKLKKSSVQYNGEYFTYFFPEK